MIELVFVIVILGVLAAVAVPRFVATRQDAQVATTRSDLASVQKAIVAKVFADNIDATATQPTDPNRPWMASGAAKLSGWGEWIMLVGGLDGSRWSNNKQTSANAIAPAMVSNKNIDGINAIQPIGNTRDKNNLIKGGCGSVLAVQDGYMFFAPNNLAHVQESGNNFQSGDFCSQLRDSYKSSNGPGNKIIPLASSGTVEF